MLARLSCRATQLGERNGASADKGQRGGSLEACCAPGVHLFAMMHDRVDRLHGRCGVHPLRVASQGAKGTFPARARVAKAVEPEDGLGKIRHINLGYYTLFITEARVITVVIISFTTQGTMTIYTG